MQNDYTNWYKLDNAAKIFPAVTSDMKTNTFRISAVLNEFIEPLLLNQALKTTLPRFPAFAVKLKKGIFWYYLDFNRNIPVAKPETEFTLKRIKASENNGYMFSVTYYNKRITIEMFHSLTDGFGATEFLKALLFHYFELKGYPVKANGIIRTALTPVKATELEDGTMKFAEKGSLKGLKGTPSHTIEGNHFLSLGQAMIYCITDSNLFLEFCRSKNSTMTEIMIAAYIFSVYKNQIKSRKSTKPVTICVPINARKYFPTETLRNFSSFAKITISFKNEDYNVEDILKIVKEQMQEQMCKENVQKLINSTACAEKIFVFRLFPLFFKNLFLKFYYGIFGEKVITSSISNMGKIVLPENMMPYIDRLEFAQGASKSSAINMGVGSYNNKLVIGITRSIMETEIIRDFFTYFTNNQIKMTVFGNHLEDNKYFIDDATEMLQKKMNKKGLIEEKQNDKKTKKMKNKKTLKIKNDKNKIKKVLLTSKKNKANINEEG